MQMCSYAEKNIISFIRQQLKCVGTSKICTLFAQSKNALESVVTVLKFVVEL